jgi:hypothetical protein
MPLMWCLVSSTGVRILHPYVLDDDLKEVESVRRKTGCSINLRTRPKKLLESRRFPLRESSWRGAQGFGLVNDVREGPET